VDGRPAEADAWVKPETGLRRQQCTATADYPLEINHQQCEGKQLSGHALVNKLVNEALGAHSPKVPKTAQD
jgi:hypothetical protein